MSVGFLYGPFAHAPAKRPSLPLQSFARPTAVHSQDLLTFNPFWGPEPPPSPAAVPRQPAAPGLPGDPPTLPGYRLVVSPNKLGVQSLPEGSVFFDDNTHLQSGMITNLVGRCVRALTRRPCICTYAFAFCGGETARNRLGRVQSGPNRCGLQRRPLLLVLSASAAPSPQRIIAPCTWAIPCNPATAPHHPLRPLGRAPAPAGGWSRGWMRSAQCGWVTSLL